MLEPLVEVGQRPEVGVYLETIQSGIAFCILLLLGWAQDSEVVVAVVVGFVGFSYPDDGRNHRQGADPRTSRVIIKIPQSESTNSSRGIVTVQFVRLRASRMAPIGARRRAPEKNPGAHRRTAARTVQDRAGAENSSSRKREMVV